MVFCWWRNIDSSSVIERSKVERVVAREKFGNPSLAKPFIEYLLESLDVVFVEPPSTDFHFATIISSDGDARSSENKRFGVLNAFKR